MSRQEIERRIVELSRRHGLTLDRTAKVERLSVGEQQHVELIKTLIGSPRILILDEPAALLSAEEVAKLWQILRDLAGQGVGIILIGHKLEDVLAIRQDHGPPPGPGLATFWPTRSRQQRSAP